LHYTGDIPEQSTAEILFARHNFKSSGGCPGQNSRTAQPPSAFGVFTAHQMAAAGSPVLDFAGSRDFDPLAQALMAFLLWHRANPLKY
jgi:hypothetical protein